MKASGRIGWTLAATAALFLTACGGGGEKAPPAADSAAAAPARAPAAAESAPPEASEPAPPEQKAPATRPKDRTPAPKPAARKPAATESTTAGGAKAGQAGPGAPEGQPAATPAPAMVSLRVASGTQLETALDGRLSTQDSKVGDRFTATVSQPVTVDGRTAIPEGATVHGEVTAVQKSGSSGQPAVLKVDFTSLTVGGESYPIAADLLKAEPQKKSRTSTGEAAVKIGAGTAAGAILGRIIGGNKTGTFIGAAVGAAAGTAIVLGTQDVDAVLPAQSPMTLQLKQPVTVRRPR
ncbi:MAG: hypothetical protein Q8W51_07875 [Candidatus Palauibacterales bacterium]|nr:hypothetical protein [Candidatus Palauibacterales bacterium]MDP2529641.1 hypothetical protein [Candidatus Palauibacterales bacterium]